MKKRLKKIVIGVGIFVALLFLLDSCMQFRLSNKRLVKKFEQLGQTVMIDTYKVDDQVIRFMEVSTNQHPVVIFVHGAPGSSKDFIQYLQDSTLTAHAHLVAVDRPGYGYSNFGKSVTSIAQQAKYLQPLLERYKDKGPIILVGHSYGGPVIARLAMDYPTLANGPLLMLAPAIDPNHEKMFWVNRPFNSVLLKWMLPSAFRVANDEKLSHAAELAKMKPLWAKLINPTVYLHGYSDKIVSIENSKYGLNIMKNAPVDSLFKQKMNHLFIWNKYELVKKELLKIIKASKSISN